MDEKNFAGKTVQIQFKGTNDILEYHVEDLWEVVSGGTSWMMSAGWGNWAAKNYRDRVEKESLPYDDDVWYGKIGGLGFLVHTSEIIVDVPTSL
jgi:hypothetical protein